MASTMQASAENGTEQPNFARTNDYWLGGSHFTEVDRKFAEHVMVVAPHIPYLVRSHRAMLGRMVRYLMSQGIRQFLDIGSGLPTLGNVHEVAQSVDPEARVVYVDLDQGLAADGQRLLAGNDRAAYLCADLREPEQVFDAPETRKLLDPREPYAVLMLATLIHFADDENPEGLVAPYIDRLPSGGYLAISHYSENEELLNAFNIFEQMLLGSRPVVNLRDAERLRSFFTGLEFVEPGVVPVPQWRPDSPDEADRNPDQVIVHAGLARKP
ncbi:SAM-dependent methyltransferase [Amycolatopsis anabasis]|uniref:SAM-dependent methyltransferase n=1 Tax=Amycolatopsis anabasis TaxID=1840409 RepID=UPI001FE8BE88|nr:SAM-dependent methyltransferase [Amycolatopsis anabasis]